MGRCLHQQYLIVKFNDHLPYNACSNAYLTKRAWFHEIVLRKVCVCMCVCMYVCMYICLSFRTHVGKPLLEA